MRQFFFSLIICGMSIAFASAQSVDFVERASKILWNGTSTNQVSWNTADDYVAASSARYDVNGNKSFYRFKNLSGFPISGIEVWPNKEWQLHWNYSNDHKERVGLCPVRSNTGGTADKYNYLGFPDLAVGDVVTIVSYAYPTILAAGTTTTGVEDKTGTKNISFTFGNSKRTYEGAKVYTYTVTTVGKLALQFENGNYIYSIDVQEPVETVKVDLDFYAQARAGIATEGTSNTISSFTDNSVRFKENGATSNTTFYTPAIDGLTMHSDVSVAPNSGWQFSNKYASDAFRIGILPVRGYNNATPNKIGITNLAVGDVVVIKSINAPTEWSASIGTGSSEAATYTFAYGNKNNRTQDINVYTYTVTTAGKMAWKFEAANGESGTPINTIISIKVSRTDMHVKAVANNYPITISSGWASFCASEDVTIADGLTAYLGSEVQDESGDKVLVLTEIEGGKIKANTGVVLAGTDGTYNLTATTGASSMTSSLTGTVARTANPNTSTTYGLNSDAGVFQQYQGAYIPANKAYLTYETSGSAPARLRMQIGSNKVPTDVDAISNQPAAICTKTIENGQLIIIREGVKYNVQGQIVK